jgi:hypothetical protein
VSEWPWFILGIGIPLWLMAQYLPAYAHVFMTSWGPWLGASVMFAQFLFALGMIDAGPRLMAQLLSHKE